MLSEVFWSFFITSIVAFLIAVARMLYKSKCKEFGLCGLKIIRDVNLEAEIDEEMIDNGINPSDSSRELKHVNKPVLYIKNEVKENEKENKV